MKIESIVLREIRMPLVRPFETSFGRTTDRRILLAEVQSEGVTGWGECTAGEHPSFSEESTDTAWLMMANELVPALLHAEIDSAGSCPKAFSHVRGNRMAKAALENAVWDAESQQLEMPLAEMLGGIRKEIACGVSLGLQPSLGELLERVEIELAAGYRRIKLKCKPGHDVDLFEAVRHRWPDVLLSCDANASYRLKDQEHLRSFDAFRLLMIEQPLWHDDFYFHSVLQRQLETSICLDESIRNRRDALAAIEMESCRVINVKLGRVGGFSEAIRVHNLTAERSIPVWCGGMLETGIGRAHNIALSSLQNFSLPGDVSASSRYFAEDIIDPPVQVSASGTIAVPQVPGRGFEVVRERVEKLTVRSERFQARNRVGSNPLEALSAQA
ncbi:MAG: o-succinylbenzoate synthase [Acidobacteriaceae bacterium]